MKNTTSTLFANRDLHIMVIGDTMIDRYMAGSVYRISPEAPVPVVQNPTTTNRLGGAANVAMNLQSLGVRTTLISVTGDDGERDLLLHLLASEKMPVAGLIAETGRRTTLKTRVMAGNQQLLRVDQEDTVSIREETTRKLLARIESIFEIDRPRAVLLQDYDKGVFTPEFIAAIIGMAKAAGIPVSVDPKFKHFKAYKGVTLFKPNLKELNEGMGRQIEPSEAALEVACRLLNEELGHEMSLVTLSEKGIYYYDHKSGKGGLVTPIPRDIVDVCGAGDTVISVATLALASGVSLETIAFLANLAGGLVCERPGVVAISRDDFMQEINTQETLRTH